MTLDYVMLSRLQFAFTAMFHILWPVAIIGLSIFLVVLEILWVKTHHEQWYKHARFWTKIFLLNTALGIATGYPMEFQFGMNWSIFSEAGGDFLGHMLGYEAAMAFMLEASFLGIMAFGWKRVSPGMHLFATCMVAFGASLSAFWIMTANSWMHSPNGGYFDKGKFVITDHVRAIFNSDMFWNTPHMWLACLEISLFIIGGISAWYMLKNRDTAFFLKSFKIAVIVAIFVTPLQIFVGDGVGVDDLQLQPAKLAAMESHWFTNPPGTGAAWHIVAWPDEDREENKWEINIPYGLSLIVTRSLTGQVKGLREIPQRDRPPILIPFYSFRIMVACGMAFFFLMLWTLWEWRRGNLIPERIGKRKALLYSWMVCLPLSYLAMEAGWAVREVGRQPWVIYNLMRTAEGVSRHAESTVVTSFAAYIVVYTILFFLFLGFARFVIRKGP